MTDNSETFQAATDQFLYEPGQDPTALMLSKTDFQKFDMIKHHDTNSLVFLNNRMFKQLFKPREVLVSDSSSHVAGFIGSKPNSAVIAVIDKVAMLDWYPSYMDANPGYPLQQGTQAIDVAAHFDPNKEKPDFTDCRACYTPLWAIKQNGFDLSTPLHFTHAQDLSDDFEAMGQHGALLDAWYWAQKISDRSIKGPTKRMLPTGTYDCAAKASLEYRIITEDDVEWFGEANWNALQSELKALSGTSISIPPAVSTVTGGSQPQAHTTDRDIILELVKQKDSSEKKDDKKMTLAKTQAIITWKVTFAQVEDDRLIMPDLTETYKQLLDEKKSERLGVLRSIHAAKQRELCDSEHIIMAETWFPPLNATTCELLHDGEFAGTHADDPLQMGLTILHCKAPDLDSESYKAFMNQACTVAAEERVDEDARKRTVKTSRPYMSGREATKEDVVSAFANFLGMADCFVVLNVLDKGGPASDIAQFAYKLAMTIKSNKFNVWVKNAMKEDKHHVMHSMLAHFGNVFRAFVSLARDIRLQNLIKDSTQKEVMYDTSPFARVMQQGWAFLHKLKDDMDMNSFSTLDIIPGTYKPPRIPKRLRTTPGGNRGGGYNGNNNENNSPKGDNLLEKFGSKTWPYIPDGLGFCKFSILAHKDCGKHSCKWKHPRVQDVTKEQGEKFHKGWQARYQFKPTVAFQRHLDNLGCNLACPPDWNNRGNNNRNTNRNGGNNNSNNANGSENQENGPSSEGDTSSNNENQNNNVELDENGNPR